MKQNDNNQVTTKFKIIKDRIEIYKDFTFNLLHYIYDYYLDIETLSLDQDIKNHFLFCYNKTCNDFLKEEIDFSENKELIEYFYVYYYHHFYKVNKEIKIDFFVNFWNSIFNVDNPRNKNLLNVMVELYQVFDQSISNKKNILEFV
jgi:hypothetical protein